MRSMDSGSRSINTGCVYLSMRVAWMRCRQLSNVTSFLSLPCSWLHGPRACAPRVSKDLVPTMHSCHTLCLSYDYPLPLSSNRVCIWKGRFMVIKCTHICRRARHEDIPEVLTVPRRLPVPEIFLHTDVSSLCMFVPCANPVKMLCPGPGPDLSGIVVMMMAMLYIS